MNSWYCKFLEPTYKILIENFETSVCMLLTNMELCHDIHYFHIMIVILANEAHNIGKTLNS